MRPALTRRPFALLPLALAASGAWAQSAASAPAGALPETLPVVVVSATRHALALLDAPAAVSVVTREQVLERGNDNLLALLRAEPSISAFGKPTGGRKALSLRGMDPRHTLMLMDGQRIAASDGLVGSSDFQLDWTGGIDIERIEVVRGPMSVLYGAEALGGVINVITRPLPEAFEAQVLVEGRAGTDGGSGHRAGATLRGRLAGPLRYSLSVSDQRRESTPSRDDAQISAVEGRHPREAALRLEARPAEGHLLRLDARHSHEDRWLDARERSGLRRYHQSLHELVREHAGLSWEADWGQSRETLLRAYRSELAVNNQKTNGVASLRPNTLRDAVLEGQGSLRLTPDARGTFGFESREERVINAGLPGGAASAQHEAGYGQVEAQLDPAFALTAGLRADHHSRFGNELSPRTYGVAKLAPGWVLKGGLARGFKAPTVKQIEPAYKEDEGPNTYLGNAALRPEVNQAAELGLAYDSPRYAASAMAFRNEVRDLITPVLLSGTAARGTYQFRNIDRAVLQGLELAAAWQLGPWKLHAQATQLSARDGNGVWLDKRAARQWGLRAEYRGAQFGAGLGLERQSGLRLATGVAGQAPAEVPSIQMLNAFARWTLSPQITLRAGVDNASNTRLAATSPLFSYEELPRTWRLGLDARF